MSLTIFKKNLQRITIAPQLLNLLVAMFIAILLNMTFNEKVFSAIPDGSDIALHFCATLLINTAIIYIFLAITSLGRIQKKSLIIVLLCTSLAAYFIDNLGTIIDDNMILNIINTDSKEVFELITVKLLFYIIFLGLLPSALIAHVNISYSGLARSTANILAGIVISLLIVAQLLLSFSQFYAPFIRNHKSFRYYSNPIFPIYSISKYINKNFSSAATAMVHSDSRIPASDYHRELIVLVVGETARADHFSLNGYEKKTNPLLEKENVVSYSNLYSCGTSTAVSVPCMFSGLGQKNFSKSAARNTENLLDILNNTKDVEVLWRDNNSDSKGVASRVPFESFKTSDRNKVCDPECRDIGMLEGLQEFINQSQKKDILIVLHQMGNHGPAYHNRYPPTFEQFKPTCKTQDLNSCSDEEIKNSYDNAILYTDFFLSKVIEFLKKNDGPFETAMIYMSDHGESLGENGIYLHGLPYALAPDEQKKVAAIFWFGNEIQNDLNMKKIILNKNSRLSHDNFFHSVLGLFEVESDAYKKEMDIFR